LECPRPETRNTDQLIPFFADLMANGGSLYCRFLAILAILGQILMEASRYEYPSKWQDLAFGLIAIEFAYVLGAGHDACVLALCTLSKALPS